MILEEQDVLEAPIFLQIEDAIAKSPEYIFDPSRGKGSQGRVVIGCFDDHLVRADPIHLVEHAFGLFVEVAFDPECRKFVGHNAYGPAWAVFHGRRAVRAWAIRQNLRWSLALVAVVERTKAASLGLERFPGKVGGALGAIRGNNHPSSHDGVFS